MEDFVKSIKLDREPLHSGYDDLRAVQIAHGIYRSAKTGKIVAIYEKEDQKPADLSMKIFKVS